MNNILWQDRAKVVYGKDYSEGSIVLDHKELVILDNDVTFDDFWKAEDQTATVKDVIMLEGITISDFYDFLYHMEMEQHFYDIIQKWIELRKEVK